MGIAADLYTFRSTLQQVQVSLHEYAQALRGLYEHATVKPRQVGAELSRCIEALESAGASLADAQAIVLRPFFLRAKAEFDARRDTVSEAAELTLRTGGAEQNLAALVALISSLFAQIFLALEVNSREQILGTLRLPETIASVRRKQRRAKRWLCLCVVGVALGILGLVPVLMVIGWLSAFLGLALFLADRYYVSERYYPGSALPGRVANETAQAIEEVEQRIQAFDAAAQFVQNLSFELPGDLEAAYQELLNGTPPSEEELRPLIQEGLDYAMELQLMVRKARQGEIYPADSGDGIT